MQHFWQNILNNKLCRFLLSSGVGFLVDVLLFFVLYSYVLTQPRYTIFISMGRHTLSLAISFFMGVLVNFLMAKYIVFTQSTLSSYKQFARFVSIAIIGFFANLLILHIMINVLNLYVPLARILTALSLFFASYFVHKVFSFNLTQKHGFKTDNK